MKKKIIILLGLLTLTTALYSSLTFSWYMDKEEAGTVNTKTAKIVTELDFALNTNYGIPGETIAVTKDIKDSSNRNTILTNGGTVDYIFRISYTVDYPDGVPDTPYIVDLKLSNPENAGLIPASNYNADDQKLIYYGRHNLADGNLDLGELHATFAVMKKSEMNKPFTIVTEVEACQITEEAVFDILRIDSSVENGKYSSLFSSSYMEVLSYEN